jgi:uncharacterized membrane protein
MVTVLGFTAFASDLGLQRVAARDMQAVADLVALDTARKLPTCTTSTLQAAANASLARQNRRMGRTSPLVVTPGYLDSTGAFVPGAGASGCDAVRITAATTVDFAFAPVIGTDSGTATRSAVGARADAAVCFSAGTKAVVLDSSASALGPLLDRVIKVNGLDVVGYTGIVNLKNLQVPLVDLAAALGVGSPQELAALDVSLQTFTLAVAKVVRNQGDLVRATLLESIAAKATSLRAKVGKFLAVDSTGRAAMSADVNALDLVGAAILAANGTNALRVDQLGITVPLDLVNANTTLTVIEPPRIACGKVGVKATTAQVRLDIDHGVNAVNLTSASVKMGVEVAQGTAELTAITCTSPQKTTIRGTTGVARVVGYQAVGNAGLTVKLLTLNLAGIKISGDVGSNTTTQDFPYPPAPDLKQHFGGTTRIILKAETTGIIGLLSPLLNPVLDTVNALTGTLDLLLRPVLALLGIQVGSMDVMMLSKPSCAAVRLAG